MNDEMALIDQGLRIVCELQGWINSIEDTSWEPVPHAIIVSGEDGPRLGEIRVGRLIVWDRYGDFSHPTFENCLRQFIDDVHSHRPYLQAADAYSGEA